MGPYPPQRVIRRRRTVALALVAVVVVGVFLLLRGRGNDTAPTYSPLNLGSDPYSYSPSKQADFESRAAAGHSHAIYVKSPGGIVATAARVARYRDDVEKAAS